MRSAAARTWGAAFRPGLTMLCLLALIAALPARAQQVEATGSDEVLLRNGQWTWIESASFQNTGGAGAASGISLLISLPSQMAYVYRDGVLIAASTVSTGKPGKTTPRGEFTILQKRVHHKSNLYSNAPMPFMQRLTWTGIALHAGQLPGYPASHGCIRFPRIFAQKLFAITQLGTAVSIVDYEIVDPRVRRGAPRLTGEQIAAARPQPPVRSAPILNAEVEALAGGDYDVVTARFDVIAPGVDARVTHEGSVFLPDPRQSGRRSVRSRP